MKNRKPAEVVALYLGEEMYPQEVLAGVIESARQKLLQMKDCHLIAEHTIMNPADSGQAREALANVQADLYVLVFVSWHITPYVTHVLAEHRGVPLLIWGIAGTTDATGKLHSPAAAAGITGFLPIAKELGFRTKVILEIPGKGSRSDEVAREIRMVACAKHLRSARIGLIGYADMGLYTCAYDKVGLFKKLGIDIEDYSGYEIAKLMETCAPEAVSEAVERIRRETVFENDIPPRTLEQVARLYCVMKGKADGRNLDAISIKCVDGAIQLGFNPCLAQTMLASRDLSVICECDAYGLVTSILLSTVSDSCAAFMEHYEAYEDAALVGVCGFIPPDFVEGPLKIRAAHLGEINTGISNVSRVKEGEVTFGRFYQENGVFKLFLCRGTARACPKWTELGWAEPTPDFPAVLLAPDMPMQQYLESVPGQHIIMVYGDHEQEVRRVCELLGIEVTH